MLCQYSLLRIKEKCMIFLIYNIMCISILRFWDDTDRKILSVNYFSPLLGGYAYASEKTKDAGLWALQ
jgi:hypothetical protein